MSQIIKPQNPVINWGNPLAKGLVLCFPFFEIGNTKINDLVTKQSATLSGTYNRTITNSGIGINFDGITGQGEFTNTSVIDNVSLGSLFVLVKTTQTSVGNDAMIAGRINPSQSNGGFCMLMTTGGAIFSQFKNTAATTACNLSGTKSINDGKVHAVVINFSQANGGTNSVYVDGVLDASGTNGIAWTWNVANVIRWGVPVDGYWSPFNGVVIQTSWYNRNLSTQEIQSLSANPFQIYQQPKFPYANSIAAAAAGMFWPVLDGNKFWGPTPF